MARSYVWSGRASSEGGPILVADVDAYGRWRGAHQTWSNDGSYRVHYYGPLIERLPASLQPSGADEWHQYAICSGIEAARAYVRELREAAQRLEPKLTSREQSAMTADEIGSKARAASASESGMTEWLKSWRDHLEQGIDLELGDERLLHIDVAPDTDYAKACEALTGDVAFLKLGDAPGLVWELEGPGTASIARAEDSLLLLRIWEGGGDDDDSEAEQAARAYAETAEEGEVDAGSIRFTSGSIVVVWSPVAAADTVGEAATEEEVTRALSAASKNSPAAQLHAVGSPVGAIVRLSPGEYRVRHGEHEADKYLCRWLRISA
jgi:hypothetical protein